MDAPFPGLLAAMSPSKLRQAIPAFGEVLLQSFWWRIYKYVSVIFASGVSIVPGGNERRVGFGAEQKALAQRCFDSIQRRFACRRGAECRCLFRAGFRSQRGWQDRRYGRLPEGAGGSRASRKRNSFRVA